jgi:hypothetical protein
VTSIFAGSHTIADRILIERIRELARPADWSVVSSDHEVREAAQRRKMKVRSSQEFAGLVLASPQTSDSLATEDALSETEVDEWLKVFGQQKKRRTK